MQLLVAEADAAGQAAHLLVWLDTTKTQKTPTGVDTGTPDPFYVREFRYQRVAGQTVAQFKASVLAEGKASAAAELARLAAASGYAALPEQGQTF